MKKPEILLDLSDLNKEDIKLGRVVKRDLTETHDTYAKMIEGPGPAPKFEPKFDPTPKAEPKFEPKVDKVEPKKEPEKVEPSK
jgi:hypothetical protein